MTKQLMIYESAVPLSSEAHRDLSVKAEPDLRFAAGINSVPLVAAEFDRAGSDLPIVFAGEGEALFPVAVLGLDAGHNAFLDGDGRWTAAYVPAFLRRYPFVFSRTETDGDDARFTLCIDDSYPGVNTEGRGERLFDADGARTQYLENILRFATEYQSQFETTQAFSQRLEALDLLEPSEATVTRPDGTTSSLTGFRTVNVEKLRTLADADALDLLRSGGLELCYRQAASLGNLSRITPSQPEQTDAET